MPAKPILAELARSPMVKMRQQGITVLVYGSGGPQCFVSVLAEKSDVFRLFSNPSNQGAQRQLSDLRNLIEGRHLRWGHLIP